MAFFKKPISALLILFLSVTISITMTSAYTTIASSPSASPSPSPAIESDSLLFDVVSTIPIEEQARDAQYLETNMAKAADKLELFVGNVVEKRLNDPFTDDSTKECLDVCTEVYGNAVDALKKGLEDVNVGDFLKANIDVSAFTNNIDTCEECLVNVDDSELQKFKDWVKGVGNDCLDKIAKYSTTINNYD